MANICSGCDIMDKNCVRQGRTVGKGFVDRKLSIPGMFIRQPSADIVRAGL